MKYLFLIVFVLSFTLCSAQTSKEDSVIVNSFFSEALSSYEAYNNLEHLCKNIGGRIGGSESAAEAVQFTFEVMQNMDFDTVYLQETKVAVWNRGNTEKGQCFSENYGNHEINVCALGGSIGTTESGIRKHVLEVNDLEELESLELELVKDKIIFFNKPFNPVHFYTFESYREVARNRYYGPSIASELGAAGVIVRSMTHQIDTTTHTGITKYLEVENAIPSFAISTIDANTLSKTLKQDPNLELYLYSDCSLKDDAISHNVIGEIRGNERAERIITVGGHLDAWDNGEGAHDDGVGCIQSIEVARIFMKLGIKPKNTIRVVMFMDEEMNQRGAETYAKETISLNEEHYFAFESDRGGFSPLGFSVDADSTFIIKVKPWFGLLYEYGVYRIEEGFSGVDIAPLKDHNIPLAALITDSQRYFDYQHAESDVFEAVNRREMQLGSAAMTSFIYFIDKYGY